MAAPHISDSLTFIYNLSIKHSVFPKKWKEATVSHLHKAGSKHDVNNYRPISVLTILSEVLEKHVHDSLMNYLNKYNLLHITQSGFRPKHSCETALIGMVDRWLKSMNEGSMIGVVMVDFKKAFDLV